MKKIYAVAAFISLFAGTANALDIASLANKVQSAADKASAKLEEVQAKNDSKTEEAAAKIENKIATLKEKIAAWQSSDNSDCEETQKAIANAKASIEKLVAQLKALRGE